MSATNALLGGALGEALAAAEPAAIGALRALAQAGGSGADTAGALKAQAAHGADPAGAAETAVAGASTDIDRSFSSAAPIGTPALPCGCGDHVPAALDRVAAQQQIVDKLAADIKTNPLRQEYESRVAALSTYQDQIPGKNLDELAALAQQANQARRDLSTQYKGLTPAPLLDYIKEVNVARYDDPLGPTVDWLVDNGKKYTDIIQSAARPNPDINKLLAGFGDWLSKKPDDYVKQCLTGL
jgi:hypothetical protein